MSSLGGRRAIMIALILSTCGAGAPGAEHRSLRTLGPAPTRVPPPCLSAQDLQGNRPRIGSGRRHRRHLHQRGCRHFARPQSPARSGTFDSIFVGPTQAGHCSEPARDPFGVELDKLMDFSRPQIDFNDVAGLKRSFSGANQKELKITSADRVVCCEDRPLQFRG